MDIAVLNSKLRAETRKRQRIETLRIRAKDFDAYVYVNARELCGSAAQIGLFFVRRTID